MRYLFQAGLTIACLAGAGLVAALMWPVEPHIFDAQHLGFGLTALAYGTAAGVLFVLVSPLLMLGSLLLSKLRKPAKP